MASLRSLPKYFGYICLLTIICVILTYHYIDQHECTCINGSIRMRNEKITEKEIMEDYIRDVENWIFNKSRLNDKRMDKNIHPDTTLDADYWTLNNTHLHDMSNDKNKRKGTIWDVEYWTFDNTRLYDMSKEKNILEDAIKDVEHWKFNKTRLNETRITFHKHLLGHYFSFDRRYRGFLEYAVNKDHIYSSRCSVVGNGGILKGSGCGEEIDKADYVFRANLPPIRKFADDAGTKINLTTFNPSIVRTRYNNKLDGFKNDLHEYQGYLMMSQLDRLRPEFLSYVRENTTLIDLEFDQNYAFAVRTFVLCNKRTTTGMQLLSLALTRCAEIHLFGFWPFATDGKGNNIPHHYAEDIKWKKAVDQVHAMPFEFQLLKELHMKGVIKLHVSNCK